MLTFINTLPNWKTEKLKFDDFLSEIDDRKERKKVEKLIQNKSVSSQKIRMRKEEGATVAATPTFPHSGQLRLSGRTGSKQRLLQTIGRYSLNTRKDLTTKRRDF